MLIVSPALVAAATASQLVPQGRLTETQLRSLLTKFCQVGSLSLLHSPRQSVAFCADFPHLTCLTLRQRDTGVEALTSWPRQLKSLICLTTLRELHLHRVTQDCSPLSLLTDLRSLGVCYLHSRMYPWPVEGFVSALSQITCLHLFRCPSFNVSQHLPQLRCLRVALRVCAADQQVLTQLTRLDLDYTQMNLVTTLHYLSNIYSLTNLRHLCLRVPYMDAVTGFTAMSGLTALKLDTKAGIKNNELHTLKAWIALRHLTLRWSNSSIGPGPRKELVQTRDSSGLCVEAIMSEHPISFQDFFGDPNDQMCYIR